MPGSNATLLVLDLYFMQKDKSLIKGCYISLFNAKMIKHSPLVKEMLKNDKTQPFGQGDVKNSNIS
jgi:hypothetical protein